MSKLAKCPACGTDFLKGAMALMHTPRGFARVRVCHACRDDGETLVRDRLNQTRCDVCKKQPATHCVQCAADLARMIRGVRGIGQ